MLKAKGCVHTYGRLDSRMEKADYIQTLVKESSPNTLSSDIGRLPTSIVRICLKSRKLANFMGKVHITLNKM